MFFRIIILHILLNKNILSFIKSIRSLIVGKIEKMFKDLLLYKHSCGFVKVKD